MATEFRPAAGLKNPHLQTLWPTVFRQDRPTARRSENVTLADGDNLWLDFGTTPGYQGQMVAILHGITGSSDSPYIRGLQARLDQLGIASVAINARGHGGRPSNSTRLTSADDTDDIHQALAHCFNRHRVREMIVIGFSMGGCRLLNYLSEGRADRRVVAAATVCVPLDLSATSQRVESGFSRVYRFCLIQELRGLLDNRITHLAEHFPERAARLQALGRVPMDASFHDYSNRIVAPLYGFEDAEHYYRCCSPRQRLGGVRLPTLMIQAQDDPLMMPDSLPSPRQLPGNIRLEVTRHGGHVGFVSGTPLAPRYWLDERLGDYVCQYFDVITRPLLACG